MSAGLQCGGAKEKVRMGRWAAATPAPKLVWVVRGLGVIKREEEISGLSDPITVQVKEKETEKDGINIFIKTMKL